MAQARQETVIEGEVTAKETSLRDTLSTAWDNISEAGVDTDKQVSTEVKTGEVTKPEAKTEVRVETKETDRDVRTEEKDDSDGDEAGETKDPKDEKAVTKRVAEQDNATKLRQLPKSRAPGSWAPALREKWVGLPAEIQQQILKREREISTGFNEIHKVKEFQKSFLDLTAPYQQLFVAEGSQPLNTMNNLLRTANTLYYGNPQSKVSTVAEIIRVFNIDIKMLDQALASILDGGNTGGGVATRTGVDNVQELVTRAVSQAIAPIVQGQREQQAEQDRLVEESIEEFAADEKNEFFEDVKDTMADLLEVAAKRGQKLTLQEAYQRATLMHSDIAEIIQERQVRSRLNVADEKAKAARKKAVSVTGTPAKEIASSGGSLREDLEAAIAAQGA